MKRNELKDIALTGDDRYLQKKTGDALRKIGMPAHLKGYRYLKDAITLVIDDPELIDAMTKELYPEVAKKNDSTSSRVERSMRNAINVTWERMRSGDCESSLEFTAGEGNRKPTNAELIAAMAEKLRV